MDKNIIYTFACESRRTTHSQEMTSTIRTFIPMYNKGITHVQPITFLKEKHYLNTC
jgi:hypothetical protein